MCELRIEKKIVYRAEELKTLRESRGISVDDLVRVSGVAKSRVEDYESGLIPPTDISYRLLVDIIEGYPCCIGRCKGLLKNIRVNCHEVKRSLIELGVVDSISLEVVDGYVYRHCKELEKLVIGSYREGIEFGDRLAEYLILNSLEDLIGCLENLETCECVFEDIKEGVNLDETVSKEFYYKMELSKYSLLGVVNVMNNYFCRVFNINLINYRGSNVYLDLNLPVIRGMIESRVVEK